MMKEKSVSHALNFSYEAIFSMFENLYMKSLDEIDPTLDDLDNTFRQIAKNVSFYINVACYLFLLIPIYLIFSFADKSFIPIATGIIVNVILKPNRLIWYHLIYQPCRLVGSFIKK